MPLTRQKDGYFCWLAWGHARASPSAKRNRGASAMWRFTHSETKVKRQNSINMQKSARHKLCQLINWISGKEPLLFFKELRSYSQGACTHSSRSPVSFSSKGSIWVFEETGNWSLVKLFYCSSCFAWLLWGRKTGIHHILLTGKLSGAAGRFWSHGHSDIVSSSQSSGGWEQNLRTPECQARPGIMNWGCLNQKLNIKWKQTTKTALSHFI